MTPEDYLRYKDERRELINNIKLLSENPPQNLENKTISELMRIYYAGFGNSCARCGEPVHKPQFHSIYRSNST